MVLCSVLETLGLSDGLLDIVPSGSIFTSHWHLVSNGNFTSDMKNYSFYVHFDMLSIIKTNWCLRIIIFHFRNLQKKVSFNNFKPDEYFILYKSLKNVLDIYNGGWTWYIFCRKNKSATDLYPVKISKILKLVKQIYPSLYINLYAMWCSQ